MRTGKKVLWVGRHAKKGWMGRENSITPESIAELHGVGANLSGFVREAVPDGDYNGRIFLRNSEHKRTERTGKAVIAGAVDCYDVPRTNGDIDRLPMEWLDRGLDDRLSYGELGKDFRFDAKAIKRDGFQKYMQTWVEASAAGTYPGGYGVPITPFNDVLDKSGGCLVDAMRYLIKGYEGKMKFGVVVTSGGLTEGLAVRAANSARNRPVRTASDVWDPRCPIRDIRDIGGGFEMGDFATVEVDVAKKSGSVLGAKLVRNGVEYPVNVGRLLG